MRILTTILLSYLSTSFAFSQQQSRFNVVVLAEAGGNHIKYTERARVWLDQLALDSNFKITYISNTESINQIFLSKYQLFIQLDYPPYAWTDTAKAAFENYMSKKNGASWIGFHHATLLGEFDGYPLWQWFSDFMGGIKFKNYIPGFAKAQVNIEQPYHPIMKGLTSNFIVEKEEWYTYNRSPRANVTVLASVDENTYQPKSEVKMGDHPVIWINPKMNAKNVYVFMGHGADLFHNIAYQTIFRNAIFWAVKNNIAK